MRIQSLLPEKQALRILRGSPSRCRRSVIRQFGNDSQFVHFMNKNNQVVAQDLTKGFIDHGSIRFRAHVPVSLASLGSSTQVRAVGLERDKWDCASFPDRFCVLGTQVPLVRRHFREFEIVRGSGEQRREERGITGVLPVDFNGSDDVGFHAAHDVNLYPFVAQPLFSPLVVKPSLEASRAETCGISREIGFDGTKRKRGSLDHGSKDGLQVGILKGIQNRIEVRNVGDVLPVVRFPQVRHEATRRESAIDLERRTEDLLRKRHSRTAFRLDRFFNPAAKVVQQHLKVILLGGLCGVVRGPVLRVCRALGDFDGFRNRLGRLLAIKVQFALDRELHGDYVLARFPAKFKVRAIAKRGLLPNANGILSIDGGLRRDKELPVAFDDSESVCDISGTLLTTIHSSLPSLKRVTVGLTFGASTVPRGYWPCLVLVAPGGAVSFLTKSTEQILLKILVDCNKEFSYSWLSMEESMNSAQSVILKFGGQSALARLIGKRQGTVAYWSRSGKIPAKWQSELLELAASNGVELSAKDFMDSPGTKTIEHGGKHPKLPKAIHWGTLPIGDAELPVFVLDNGVRVISRTGATGLLTDKKGGGNLDSYIQVEALAPYMPPDLPGLSIEFELEEVVNKKVVGFSAETYIEICRAYVKALSEGALNTAEAKLTFTAIVRGWVKAQ
jgi:hypothetical protein